MGYYIQTNGHVNKAAAIAERLNGKVVGKSEAEQAMNDATKGVVVVLHNPLFEAAGFAYSMNEFKEFTDPRDTRRKDFVIISREDAERESGFNR